MLNPFDVMKEVEVYFCLDRGSLVIDTRRPKKTVGNARAIVMYIFRCLYNMSYQEIGDYFDRDHSTAKYNCNKIVKLLHENSDNYIKRATISLINKFKVEL